ncbi:MAG: pilus assembly protein TadG-related protein [Candidatus Dormibacteria bacterium]
MLKRRARGGAGGQILIMFAFSMVFLIVGMITIAVDLSELYEAHVRLQDAAEQAALAGASQVDYVAAESGSATLLPSFASACGSAGDDFSRVVGSTTCVSPPGTGEVEAIVSVPIAVSIPIPGMGATFTVSASFTAAPVLGAQTPAG